MQTKESVQHELEQLKRQYGDWVFDIPLPFGIWTKGDPHMPHTRIKRVVQIIQDLAGKPLSQCRVLDLGCLDGQFSIECASHGAATVGVEIREASIKKAMFCRDVLGLNTLEFRQDDVRNVRLESYGAFDVVICSGLLYHLTAADAVGLLQQMYRLTTRVLLIDTHVALQAVERFVYNSDDYWGTVYGEHEQGASQGHKATKLLAAWDNTTSFWFTRPSLVNLLQSTGFSSVYECFTPAHINFGRPGLEHHDRCTFVAVKGVPCTLTTSPAANESTERWPEASLSYTPSPSGPRILAHFRTLLSRLSRMAGLR